MPHPSLKLGFFFLLFGAFILGCDGGPSGLGGHVDNGTAFFEDVQVTPVAFDLDWQGGNGIEPRPDYRFYTVEIKYFNGSTAQRGYDGGAFQLQTEDARMWQGIANGRTPILASGILIPGEILRAWITFEVPRSTTATGVIWNPRPGVSLTITIPVFPR